MPRLNWDAVLRSLVLVKLGQELGTTSPLAVAVHDVLEALIAFTGVFSR
jgi:hypothetical protein